MEIIRRLNQLQKRHQRCVVTVGHFQGMHLGHQCVLTSMKQHASSLNVPTCIVLLSTHIQDSVMTLRDQVQVLKAMGIDYLLLGLEHDEVNDWLLPVLQEVLRAQLWVTGDLHTAALARLWQIPYVVCQAREHHQQRICTAWVQKLLNEYHFAKMPALLGRYYGFSGRVVHGDKRGRLLGFPTANINLKHINLPIKGVFAVTVEINSLSFYGVANFGSRPSIGGKNFCLEVHILDFQGGLYGQYLHVYPHYKLRKEYKFNTLSALQAQIKVDISAAKSWFAENPIVDGITQT